MFLPIYQEIAEFVREPEELMYTFSEALYIMDHNTERLMVSELQDTVNELRDKVSGLQAERNTIQTERDVVQIERDTM